MKNATLALTTIEAKSAAGAFTRNFSMAFLSVQQKRMK